jgi:hypothetical protein
MTEDHQIDASGPSTRANRWDRRALFVLLPLIAILAAMVFVYPRQWTRGVLVNEEMMFVQQARDIAAGNGYITSTIYPVFADDIESIPMPELLRPPGYQLVVAAALTLGFTDYAAAVGVSILWLAIAVVTFGYLAHRLLGSHRVALLLVGIYLATSTTLVHATMAVPEMQFDALFLLACVALLRVSPRRCLGAGVALAALGATKTYGLLYAPIALAYVAWVTLRPNGESAPAAPAARLLRTAGVLLAGMALTSLAIGTLAATPSGMVASSTSTYALNFMMETEAYPQVDAPRHDLDPLDPWDYFAERPSELAIKMLRIMSRTPAVLNVMGDPPLAGMLMAMLLVTAALALTLGWPTDQPWQRRYLWFSSAAIVVTLPLLWLFLVRIRYLYQLYPLMLILIATQAQRFAPGWERLSRTARRAVTAVVVTVLIVYPLALNLRIAHRAPAAFLGRGLAVHVLDYATLASDIRDHLPGDGPLVSEFAFEIPWLTGRAAIFPPLTPDQLTWIIDRWDITGIVLRASDEQPPTPPGFELRLRREGYTLFWRNAPAR